jgi:hypothetical protein
MSLHSEPPPLQGEAPHSLNYDFDADPDKAFDFDADLDQDLAFFHSNADPDLDLPLSDTVRVRIRLSEMMLIHADPDSQHWFTKYISDTQIKDCFNISSAPCDLNLLVNAGSSFV